MAVPGTSFLRPLTRRLAATSAALLLLVGVGACDDGPAGTLAPSQLSMALAGPGEGVSILPNVFERVDNLVVEVELPTDETIRQTFELQPDDDAIRASVALPIEDDEVTVRVLVELREGTEALFTGTGTTVVSRGQGNEVEIDLRRVPTIDFDDQTPGARGGELTVQGVRFSAEEPAGISIVDDPSMEGLAIAACSGQCQFPLRFDFSVPVQNLSLLIVGDDDETIQQATITTSSGVFQSEVTVDGAFDTSHFWDLSEFEDVVSVVLEWEDPAGMGVTEMAFDAPAS